MSGFIDSLRIEVAPYKVSVTMIYPGFVATAVREHAFDKDGQSVGRSTVRASDVMTVETCAQLVLRATEQRKREEVMTWRGKLGGMAEADCAWTSRSHGSSGYQCGALSQEKDKALGNCAWHFYGVFLSRHKRVRSKIRITSSGGV